jgi:hypothetical protein
MTTEETNAFKIFEGTSASEICSTATAGERRSIRRNKEIKEHIKMERY